MEQPLTRQEMFNRAYKGLASQNWEKCLEINPVGRRPLCVYDDGAGKHCAWGWVDKSLGPEVRMTVEDLVVGKIGLAAELATDDVPFAKELQRAHDRYDPKNVFVNMPNQPMKKRFEDFAARWNLTIPEEKEENGSSTTRI